MPLVEDLEPAARGRGGGGPDRGAAPVEGGRLRGADQAPDHRAAAGHHGARRWSSPTRGLPVALADASPPSLGGTLAAGGANAINMYVDRDIDAPDGAHQEPAARHRRHRRPGPPWSSPSASRSSPSSGSGATVNLLSAVLAVAACLFYVFVYTLWLKRTSTQQHRHRRRRRRRARCSSAGRRSPTRLGWAPVVLFAVIFFWTPPHFWALAIKYKDDYAAADVPMLPVGGRACSTHRRADRSATRVCSGPSPWCSRRSPTWAPSTWCRAVVLGAVFTWLRRAPAAGARPEAGHAPVHLLDHLHHPALRGHGARRSSSGTGDEPHVRRLRVRRRGLSARAVPV